MTGRRTKIAASLNKISKAAASAHKDGYQVAVLAVKQDEQGSKFAFKYEGVEGKPFKLLEQLFMELVCGSGDTHSHSSDTASVADEKEFACTTTRYERNDSNKLQLLINIANLMDTTKSKTCQKNSVSKPPDYPDLNLNNQGLGYCASKDSEQTNPKEDITMDKQLELSDHPCSEEDHYTNSLETYNYPMEAHSDEDISHGEMAQTDYRFKLDPDAGSGQTPTETADSLPWTSDVKSEPTDMELSVSEPECASAPESLPGHSKEMKYRKLLPKPISSSNTGNKATVRKDKGAEIAKPVQHFIILPATLQNYNSLPYKPTSSNSSSLHPSTSISGTGLNSETRLTGLPDANIKKIHPIQPASTTVSTTQKTIRHSQCPHCELACGSAARLKIHINLVHDKTNLFNCPHCPFAYERYSDLRTHVVVTHHSERFNEMTDKVTICEEDGRYQCPLCSYKGKLQGHVNRHIIIVHSTHIMSGTGTMDRCDWNVPVLTASVSGVPHTLEQLPGKKEMECKVCSDRKAGNRHRARQWCPTCKAGVHKACFERFIHTVAS